MLSSFISGIINYIYPSKCPSCDRETDNFMVAPFCKNCWSGIKKYSGPSCRICSTPFTSEYSTVCSDCLKRPPSFSKVLSFGLYDRVLAAAINHYKFYGIKRLYRPLGELLFALEMPEIDAIVPVPLSITGLRKRGFNQALLISKIVSGHMKKPMIIDGLIKQKDTHAQIGLSAKERAANLKGAFVTRRDFSGKMLMLVDDVMTTGATANECSKQLMNAGARDVVVITLARAGRC